MGSQLRRISIHFLKWYGAFDRMVSKSFSDSKLNWNRVGPRSLPEIRPHNIPVLKKEVDQGSSLLDRGICNSTNESKFVALNEFRTVRFRDADQRLSRRWDIFLPFPFICSGVAMHHSCWTYQSSRGCVVWNVGNRKETLKSTRSWCSRTTTGSSKWRIFDKRENYTR